VILLGVGLYVNLLSKRIDELREGMKAMDAGQREGNKALNEKGLNVRKYPRVQKLLQD